MDETLDSSFLSVLSPMSVPSCDVGDLEDLEPFPSFLDFEDFASTSDEPENREQVTKRPYKFHDRRILKLIGSMNSNTFRSHFRVTPGKTSCYRQSISWLVSQYDFLQKPLNFS